MATIELDTPTNGKYQQPTGLYVSPAHLLVNPGPFQTPQTLS